MLVFFCGNVTTAQKCGRSFADSVWKDYKTARADSARINDLLALGNWYAQVKEDSSLLCCRKALLMAQTIEWNKGICNAFTTLAIAKRNSDDRDSAIYYLNKARTYANERTNANGVVIMYAYFAFEFQSLSHDSTLHYGRKALKLAQDGNFKDGIVYSKMAISSVFMLATENDSAVRYNNEALQLATEIVDSVNLGWCHANIARRYGILGETQKSISQYKIAASVFENIDNIKGISTSYGGASIAYMAMGDYGHALEMATKGYKILLLRGAKREAAYLLSQIGSIYMSYHKEKEAIEVHKQVQQLLEESGRRDLAVTVYSDIAAAYMLLGQNDSAVYYADMAVREIARYDTSQVGKLRISWANGMKGAALMNRGDYSTAYNILKDAADFHRKTNNLDGLSYINYNLGQWYLNAPDSCYRSCNIDIHKRNILAKGIFLQVIAFDSVQHDYEYEGKSFLALSTLYKKENNYREAYNALMIAYSLHDSTVNADKKADLVRQEMQLKFEREDIENKLAQEKRDAIVAADLRNQHLVRNFSVLGLVLSVIIAVLLFRQYRASQTTAEALAVKNLAIDEARQRAEQSEKFKQQFLANMSHEIRTPMNAVSGMTVLLLEKGPRPDQVEYLKAISKSSDILLHIINDILDLSKIEAGKLELEQIDFSIQDVVKQVADTLSYKAEEKGLILNTELQDSLPQILLGDPYRLSQILTNLGGNAVKFTDKGGVQIKVSLEEANAKDVKLRFDVTDTGIGIPADKLGRLFSDFSQVNTSDTRKYGGTGLGLSISRQLVELQGGAITVESKEGIGTTFSFTIPYKISSQEKYQQKLAQEQAVNGHALDGLRILIADDNEYNRLVANETLLLKARVKTFLATNGQEAIDILRANDIDVILMDVQMPVMSGLDATRYIRKELPAPKKNVPIVAMTASVLRSDLDLCRSTGMDSYVPKPFKTWQLLQTIAEVTGKEYNSVTASSPEALEQQDIAEANSLVDLSYLQEFCENDEERIKVYIKLFLEEVPPFVTNISNAISNKNRDSISVHIHSFKPKWMMMGMKAIRVLADNAEAEYRQKEPGLFDTALKISELTQIAATQLNSLT